ALPRMRRQALQTRGPWRRTSSSNATSSRRLTNRPSSWPSVSAEVAESPVRWCSWCRTALSRRLSMSASGRVPFRRYYCVGGPARMHFFPKVFLLSASGSNWWIKTARSEDNEVEATMGARYESMPTSPLNMAIRHLLADLGPDGGGMTDGELLARFLGSRDDSALAALVRRHAPMVWGVCCRLLHNRHDVEDAFQATFLVLVRKAADVPRHTVANWLYGVARQTAVRLRATAAKRGQRETQVVTMPEPTVTEVRDADLHSVLDEELSRLPDHYRGVIALCDLEGNTRKEAARQLGIAVGTVASRLARARALLAKRLTRRGVGFSGRSVAAALSAGSASASAPPALVASTIKAASLLAARRAAGVAPARVA